MLKCSNCGREVESGDYYSPDIFGKYIICATCMHEALKKHRVKYLHDKSIRPKTATDKLLKDK